MTDRRAAARRLALTVVLVLAAVPAGAASFAQVVSDATKPVITIAAALPAFSRSHRGLAAASRRYDAQLVTMVATSLVKDTVHEWRPNRSDRKSFPSGHASAAFALAGSLAEEHPKHKWLYIGLASVVGWSRVELRKHHWHDVAAGAALGYACGKWSSGSEDGVLVGKVFKW